MNIDYGIANISRRRFVQAAAGLTLAIRMPAAAAALKPKSGAEALIANAFVSVATDGTITVLAKHLEMGQGSHTGLATLVAEEMDADWGMVRVAGAPADAAKYNNLFWGKAQGTGGSNAMANAYEQMRRAGASARAMLVSAAARAWQVDADAIEVEQGVMRHAASGRHASFGEFALAAASENVPAEPKLKSAKQFRLIGKHVPRVDSKAKTNGSAIYTQDIQLPGMIVAVVAHPPRFLASVRGFDAAAARRMPGVFDVVAIPSGVAVLARDYWSAHQAREKLKIDWDESHAWRGNTEDLIADYRKLAQQPGTSARQDGNVEAALASAAKVFEAEYVFPYLAHAAMEPLNCVIQLGADQCEVWNGEQFQTVDQAVIAGIFGLKPEQVKLNMLYAGGSFGRRANPGSDYLKETAFIAKALAGGKLAGRPVKLVWSREDDTRAGWYRPLYLHRLRAGVDAAGKLVAWQHRIVGQSILKGTPFEGAMVKSGIDPTSVEGAANLPYAIPNLSVDLHTTTVPVPVQWWRSVGSTHTAYSSETFLDEIALATGKDPLAWRLELLAGKPRHLAALKLAAEHAGWGTPSAGIARGVAVHEAFNTVVAQIADVRLGNDGSIHVERVVVGVDCGIAINPDVIRAQMEGGLGYGLSAALHGAITIVDGQVQQSNFHDYMPLRIDEMPKVDVHIVASAAPPTGVGEPATPVIAPAVANAIAQATGKRLYRLPFKLA